MTQIISNVGLAQRGYELFANGDIETLLGELIAPSIAWVEPDVNGLAAAGIHNGVEDVAQNVFGTIEGQFGNTFNLDIQQWIDGGDTVCAIGTWTGTIQSTGRTFTTNVCQILTFNDGLLVNFQNLCDTAPIRAAL